MNYSYALTKHIPEIHAALISDIGMYKDGYTFKKYQRSDNETAHFETANLTAVIVLAAKLSCLI